MRPQATQASVSDRPDSFQLKGGLFPMNLLEVKTLDVKLIADELERKVKKAPAFFENAPIVIGFEQLPEEDHARFDLPQLISLCRRLNLQPAAIRGGSSVLQTQSAANGLATIAKGKEKHLGAMTENPKMPNAENDRPQAQATPEAESPKQLAPSAPTTKIVSTPIRSGQQIYSPGDLIVLSSVSAGAEVLADGNIHVYGALRGRALAGVQGNDKARIFCSSQEAELISIAGHFLVDEQLKSKHWKQAVQVQIKNETVEIAPLP